MTDQQKISAILKRREYFDLNFPELKSYVAGKDNSNPLSNTCPSCGYLTLDSRGIYDLCSFCNWEDDGQYNHDADLVCEGPNEDYSLTAHRLEIYDLMNSLKENRSPDNSVVYSIGQELMKLDTFFSNNELNIKLVLNQIELLSDLFHKFRQSGSNRKPN